MHDKTQYAPVHPDEGQSAEWPTERLASYYPNSSHWTTRLAYSAWVVLFLLWTVTAVHVFTGDIGQYCAKHLTVWSPAISAVSYTSSKWHNDFHLESIYRGSPTAEKEAAWEQLWNVPTINIPTSRLQSLNKSNEDVDWQMSAEIDGGGIVGSLEVFHQLHCAHAIRKYIYRDDWDYYQGEDVSLEMLREHADHCLYTIMLSLKCHADITPYMQRHDGVLHHPTPDFNTQHKCRDFDKLQDWMTEHARMAEAQPPPPGKGYGDGHFHEQLGHGTRRLRRVSG